MTGGFNRRLAAGMTVLALTVLTACGTTLRPREDEYTLHPKAMPVSDRLKPVDYGTDISSNRWNALNSRSQDPRPLTVREVFGRKKSGHVRIALGGLRDRYREIGYTLQGPGQLDSDCSQAVWGDRLKAALRSHGCTQILRAVYREEDGEIAAHVAVFNLHDVTGANTLLSELDPTHQNGFLKPMPHQTAPLNHFGAGYTAADASAYGHYVVVCWVGFTNGNKGDSADGIDGVAPWSQLSRMALEQAFLGFLDERL